MATMTRSIFNGMVDVLAADTDTFNAGLDLQVKLIKAAFTPNPDAVLADFDAISANFTGSTPLATTVGAQPTGTDPATGDYVLHVKSPAGGWRWETTDTVSLNQTIHGWVLFNGDSSELVGMGLLPTPVELSAANQFVEIDEVEFRFRAGSVT